MIGFICALDVEVEGIKKMMDCKTEQTIAKITYTKGKIFGKEVVCCECGLGKVNAAMSTQIMIDLYQPGVIINSGIGGSLSKDIRIGDIVISDDCVQHDMDGTEPTVGLCTCSVDQRYTRVLKGTACCTET